MKECPQCKRTYADESITFCLADGALLSAPYDPEATQRLPTPRITNPPKTEPLVDPDAFQSFPKRRNSLLSYALISVLALVMGGGIIAALKLGSNKSNTNESTAQSEIPTQSRMQDAQPKPSVVSPATPANSNASANVNKGDESKQPNNTSLQWLDGVWEGKGYQSNTKTTWHVRLTVQNGTYAIEYPDIPCGGRWRLDSQNSRGANFTEVITHDTRRCDNYSNVMLEKVSDTEISCKYTQAGRRVVIATAVLSKTAQSTEQK